MSVFGGKADSDEPRSLRTFVSVTVAAGNGGACPVCMARCLVDTAASIAELTLGHSPADWLEREAQRVRDELYEDEPTLQ